MRSWLLTGLLVMLTTAAVAGCGGKKAGVTANQDAAGPNPPLAQIVEATATASPTAVSEPAQTPEPTAAPYVLSLVSGSCTRLGERYLDCQGFVKNVSDTNLELVELYVILLDSDGVPQASDNTLIDYSTLLPGQESPWQTLVDYNPLLTTFRFEFHDFRTRTPLSTRDDRPPGLAFSVVAEAAPTATPVPPTAGPPTAVPTSPPSTGYSGNFDYDQEFYDAAAKWLNAVASGSAATLSYLQAACDIARKETIPDAGTTFVALFDLVSLTGEELDVGSLLVPEIRNAYGKALLDQCINSGL